MSSGGEGRRQRRDTQGRHPQSLANRCGVKHAVAHSDPTRAATACTLEPGKEQWAAAYGDTGEWMGMAPSIMFRCALMAPAVRLRIPRTDVQAACGC